VKDLKKYDLVIVNSSGGKDSICALFEILRLADRDGFPKDKIIVSHQDLGESEWQGTKELVQKQSDHFGLHTEYSMRRDKNGHNETFLEYTLRRKMWPSNGQRWCTSDFKRGPGARVVTRVTKGMGECNVLYVFGFRKEESPSRKKKEVLTVNKMLTTNKRKVDEFLPIHDWDTKKVWDTIKGNKLPYHFAYDLGMPRLSCVFCIFSPFDALVVAGRANPELLDKYIEVEKVIDHTFRDKFSLQEVKDAIASDYDTGDLEDWVM
jgi:3'-phosphoadenosine 5'-phosphosulfate sulfotransferase (PAPS reductase)/FAD synthetase